MELITVKKKFRFLLLFFCIIGIVGCATQPTLHAYEPPGFLMGLVHGFCIMFSLIGSIFTEVRIYAFPNSGGWHDFGYFLGACFFLGGSGAGTR